eukprot:TRINITY_DN10935_c0_g1_i1.p1 TRINITY_DN10935_c0_g1~~TRINITY_DN10935_c0_g1_i1.p1  ORF type:complete len:633 (+),score=171.15 TRINITY_DN10935_c0_g1_i1:225-1901(+)
MKLSTRNKINQKNTWDLALIDYIDDVLNVVDSSKKGNFTTASVTLEASMKIYTSRVDSAHKDTFKMLGGLNRNNAETNEMEQEEENNNEQHKTTKKKRVARTRNTIAKNVSVLNYKSIESEFIVDPLFRKTSASFDVSGASGLLLNQLNIQNGLALIFDSSDAVDIDNEESESENSEEELVTGLDMSELENLLFQSTKDISDLEICPEYSNYKLAVAEDEESDDMDYQNFENFLDEDIEEQEQRLEKYQDTDIFDDFLPDFDVDIGSSQTPRVVSQPPYAGNGDIFITDNEFGYINGEALEKVAPEVWKYANGAKDKSQTNTKKRKKSLPKKKNFYVTFSTNSGQYKKLRKHFEIDKKGTILNNATLNRQRNSSEKYIQQEDEVYDPSKFSNLFLSDQRISNYKKNRFDFGGKDVDSFGFPSNNFGVDSHNGDDGFDFDSGAPEFDFNLEAPDLDPIDIEQPIKSEFDRKISFARQAKHVDVKSLKNNIWEEVKNINQGEFQDILSNLPEHITGTTLSDISVPYCFICLLHLANEKELVLKQNKGSLDGLSVRNDRAV